MELLTALPQLASLIEKGGIIGLLLIVCAVLVWEIRRVRKELTSLYGQRDKWRLAFVKCKAACEGADVKVDYTDLAELMGETK